ncbi:hypothetical protein GCM10020367_30100 [Streptomyces sannanensis]|uniref:ABC transporter permease n=1 Tax=Streptomyces sannanensis TaxID=285536 RepID=A0ABP6SC84_9ACTN
MSTAFTLRGPAWVAVRQHRRALWAGLGLLVLAAGYLLWVRLSAGDAAATLQATGCQVETENQDCLGDIQNYLDAEVPFEFAITRIGLVMAVLPSLLAAFVAGPLIARELESGTYKLMWSQSVSPARWLAAKLAVPGALALTGIGLFSVLYYWAWSTGPGEFGTRHWYEVPVSASALPVPLAYGVFGIAVGALTGLLVGRTVPALATGALAVGTVSVVMWSYIQPWLWPVETAENVETVENALVGSASVVDNGLLTRTGEHLPFSVCRSSSNEEQLEQCKAAHDVIGTWAEYHPSSHFLPLQLVHSGILLVLAAAAAFAAFRVLKRRHA